MRVTQVSSAMQDLTDEYAFNDTDDKAEIEKLRSDVKAKYPSHD